MIKIIIEQHI